MKNLLTLIFIFCSTLVFTQDAVDTSILSAKDSWRKEIIKFPIDWAPNLDLTGIEELRFPPFWSNPDSEEFWSLVMAWQVDASEELTIKEIEDNFEAYFDGLMKPNHWATTFPSPTVLFILNPEKDETHFLIGKMKFFDGFHTGKVITQNIKVEQQFSESTNQAFLIFRISPQGFEHTIWDELNSLKRNPKTCD